MVARAAEPASLALTSTNRVRRDALERDLSQAGLRVALSGGLSPEFLERLAGSGAEVVVVDLSADDDAVDALDALLEATELPIVFNEVTGLSLNTSPQRERAFASLVEKITALAGRTVPALHGDSPPPLGAAPATALARRVWVLGASLGGPQALKRFLGALAGDVPAAFVVVQHLGANFVARLAEQLDRVSALRVQPARDGHVLRHGDVLVAPVERRLLVNALGAVTLEPLPGDVGPYRPSVDLVARDVAGRYGESAGLILFSGMGDDGRRGALALRAAGGIVWAQAAESCVISSMPDHARAAGVVVYSGEPEALAGQLMRHLRERTG